VVYALVCRYVVVLNIKTQKRKQYPKIKNH